MNTVVIKHVLLADLPLAWRDKLPKARFARKSHVTVRIEQEQLLPTPADKEQAALKAMMANPMVGMWADRGDMADVQAYVRKLREPRYGRDGTRRKNGI